MQKIQVHALSGQRAVVELTGRFQGGTELEACISGQIARGVRFLVIDCRGVQSIDDNSVAALASHYVRLLFGGGNTVMFGMRPTVGLPMANAETLQGALEMCRPAEGVQEPYLEDGLLYLESFLHSTEVAVVRLTGALFGEQACESLHWECAPLAGRHLILDCVNLVSLHQQGTMPLWRLAQAAWECGRQIALVKLDRHPAQVLATSGLGSYFQRHASLEAALAALGGDAACTAD